MKKLAILALALVPFAAPAHAQFGAKLGMLSCIVNGGTGFVIGSSKDMQCTFTPAFGNRAQEIYSGRINKYGVDLGTTTGGADRYMVCIRRRIQPDEHDALERGFCCQRSFLWRFRLDLRC